MASFGHLTPAQFDRLPTDFPRVLPTGQLNRQHVASRGRQLGPNDLVQAGDFLDWNDNGTFTVIAAGSPYVGVSANDLPRSHRGRPMEVFRLGESLAERIVDRLLEAGEADQDYDHDQWDAIVIALEKSGISGAAHREFDKYQGIYLRIPGVDTFWVKDYGPSLIVFTPEDSPETEIFVPVYRLPGLPVKWNAEVGELWEYCKKVNHELRIRSAHQAGEEEGRDFITQMAAEEQPQQRKRRSTRPRG